MRFLYLTICTLLSILSAQAQMDIHSNATSYQDGIYASYEEFLSNAPSISFHDFDIKWGDSKYFNQLKIKKIKKRNVSKKKERSVNTSSFWGICVNGIPHIQYGFVRNYKIKFGNNAGSKDSQVNFTRIRIIGNICHFNIEDFFSAKNSIAGLSSSRATYDDAKMVRKQMIMKLATGQVADFNEHSFMAFIKDDSNLYSHFLKNDKKEAKIFLYLQKYNQRNPFTLASKED